MPSGDVVASQLEGSGQGLSMPTHSGLALPGAVGTTQRLQQLGASVLLHILIAIVPVGIGLDTTGDPPRACCIFRIKYKLRTLRTHIYSKTHFQAYVRFKSLNHAFFSLLEADVQWCAPILAPSGDCSGIGQMGRAGCADKRAHPTEYLGHFFLILVLRKRFWISTFLTGFLLLQPSSSVQELRQTLS